MYVDVYLEPLVVEPLGMRFYLQAGGFLCTVIPLRSSDVLFRVLVLSEYVYGGRVFVIWCSSILSVSVLALFWAKKLDTSVLLAVNLGDFFQDKILTKEGNNKNLVVYVSLEMAE